MRAYVRTYVCLPLPPIAFEYNVNIYNNIALPSVSLGRGHVFTSGFLKFPRFPILLQR